MFRWLKLCLVYWVWFCAPAAASGIGPPSTTSTTHTWHPQEGRLQKITSGSSEVTYTRHTDSALLHRTESRQANNLRLTSERSFDFLERLTDLTHTGPPAPAAFGYAYNDANQRTSTRQPDGTTWAWDYDPLGQLQNANLQRTTDSALLPGRQYHYQYDSTGNRLTASQGDAPDPATHASVTGYTPNGLNQPKRPAGVETDRALARPRRGEGAVGRRLNQYSTITHPAEAVASGEAHKAATVTVNGQPTTRLGPYFHKALPVPNSGSAPIKTPLTIAATENGTTESEPKRLGAAETDRALARPRRGEGAGRRRLNQIRTALTLPATESPEYDEDGNLTADSLWTYTWDAENRLITMESAPSLPAAKRVKLAFAYDAQSRRIRKQVWQAQPTTAPHALIATQTRRFCYDGWSRSDRWARRQTTPGVAPRGWLLREAELPSTYLILELDPDGTAFRQYLWGLDLSNTPQGAGGVSGLLCITLRSINNQPSTINYYPTYDGNGNLTGLTTAPTGEESATFTYDPFGQPLTATGPAAQATPFGFSTKYTDPETQLCYYGYRYYDPSDGRWLGRDPIEEEGGLNLCGMLGNEPVNQVDVNGLEAHMNYRPLGIPGLKQKSPLSGHVFLSFDETGLSESEKLEWRRFKKSLGIKQGFQGVNTFSYHPEAIYIDRRKKEGSLSGDFDNNNRLSVLVTDASFVDVDNLSDDIQSISLAQRIRVSKTLCGMKKLLAIAVDSTKKNNGGQLYSDVGGSGTDPGTYSFLNNNCGHWAYTMVRRAGLTQYNSNYGTRIVDKIVLAKWNVGIGFKTGASPFGWTLQHTLKWIFKISDAITGRNKTNPSIPAVSPRR